MTTPRISRFFLTCPRISRMTHHEVIVHDDDSITFNMLANVGTRIVHGFTLSFHRHESGVTMTVTNTSGLNLPNVSLKAALRDIAGWLQLSITDSVCFIPPAQRNRVFDIYKQACKGDWVSHLQYLRQTSQTERYSIPVELYIAVLDTLTLLAAGESFMADRPKATQDITRPASIH
jgi:hypothetical protein